MMKRCGGKEVIFMTCLLAYAARMVSCQNFGPNYCLLSRLEVIPCLRVFPNTQEPESNMYSIYNTAFARGPAGLPVCVVNPPAGDQSQFRVIESIGRNDQVKFLISPGIELDPDSVPYGNQLLVTYNVQCPENHIAFFNVTFADIEPPNCRDSGLDRCVDYLLVDRGEYGTSEGCGGEDTMTANNDQLELGTFKAIFRTSPELPNPSVEYDGFKATVTCFLQEESPPDDCTMPDSDGQAMPSDEENRRRRRRDLEEFHNEWRWHLTYLKRMKRQSPGFFLRFEEINVAHQVIVNFTDKTLIFTDTKTNTIIRSIENILFLHTFDAEGKVDEFRERGVNDKDVLIPFPGPGPMFIVGRHAYFQLFVIDPRNILPNANETAVINRLTEGQFDALVLETERLSEDFLMPPAPDPVDIGLPPIRGRRQTEGFETYDNEILILAIQNENACNPVLRAGAQATIESADPEVVESLRTTTGSGSGALSLG